ncbi:FAD-dependent oxidoreductase [Sutterella sp.]|uniref:FAD-dependent oxidoreductase n=1 Tax=Sutterella sp. TaxID=1981025 RepID=UPI0026DFE8D9|nr:FAD-dependent oxidoreductase [Sutterella sp.]MDO5530897.1 FAD-dependent oxidoreductase [Sutterella sp.]
MTRRNSSRRASRRDLSARRGGSPDQRPVRTNVWRSLVALAFLGLVALGLYSHTGWGTLSSFGWRDIAAVCPLGGLEAMLAERTLIPRALIGILAVAVVCALLGRVFCGWLCPVPLTKRLFGSKDDSAEIKPAASALSPAAPHVPSASDQTNAALSAEAAVPHVDAAPAAEAPASGEKPACGAAAAAGTAARRLEDAGPFAVLAGALASSAIFGFPVFCLVCPVGLTFALVIALWRLFEFNELTWSIGFFVVFLVLELFVLRRWCHRFCPLGAMMTLLARANTALGLFRPTVAQSKCLRCSKGLDCRVCESVCPEGIDVKGLNSGMLSSRCTKCRVCADACPSHAIHFPALAKKQAAAAAAPEAAPAFASDPAAPLSHKRAEPVRLDAAKRRTSFAAVEKDFTMGTVVEQSARCIECGACMKACPQGNDIPAWMKFIKAGRTRDAALVMLRAGSLPEVCGRVCPSERLCESACPLAGEGLGGPIPIASISRAVSDSVLDRGWQPRAQRARRRRRIAIVGAGPAGLGCADILARTGAKVTVYDRAPEIGGLLTFGIPAFKLEKPVITRRRRILRRTGVKFMLGREVGGTGENAVSMESLLSDNDAVFVAVGAEVPVMPELGNADAKGVLQARPYLAATAAQSLKLPEGAQFAPLPDMKGRRCLVIGGGDTAMDCLRSALRQGAARAVAIARKPEGQIRALPGEVNMAREEGAEFVYETRPESVMTNAAGEVTGLLCRNVATGEPVTIEGDVILVACGFHTVALDWLAREGVVFDERGRIVTDSSGRTGNPKIYAGGDAMRGAALATTALADGRAAATAIMRDLGLENSEGGN